MNQELRRIGRCRAMPRNVGALEVRVGSLDATSLPVTRVRSGNVQTKVSGPRC